MASSIKERPAPSGYERLLKRLAPQIPPETLQTLEEQGFQIGYLTGESIRSLREGGKSITLYSNVNYPRGFEFQQSMFSQVAFNRDIFLRPGYHARDYSMEELKQQMKEIEGRFKRLKGIRVAWGNTIDYLELVCNLGLYGEIFAKDGYSVHRSPGWVSISSGPHFSDSKMFPLIVAK